MLRFVFKRLSLYARIRIFTLALRLYRWNNRLCNDCGAPLKLWRGRLACITNCEHTAWVRAEIGSYRSSPWRRSSTAERREARKRTAFLVTP